MNLTIERRTLAIETPFEISRRRQETATIVIVKLDSKRYTGIGAAAPATHYGETPATVEAVLETLRPILGDIDTPHHINRHRRQFRSTIRGNPAARAAVEMALQDLRGKLLDAPLYQLWGLDPTDTVHTSYTIGIDSPDTMAQRAATAVDQGYTTLKLKLGTDQDRAIVRAVRDAVPQARIRVDANEAWTPPEAIAMSQFLAEHDIEFVEQPVPAEHPDGLRMVTQQAPLPVAADESCQTPADLPAVVDACDIVNIKLMKCGGLSYAREMIATAHTHGCEVMLGCMIESNASIAAACQLTPLVEYADLDGALLLAKDPYTGVPMPNGKIALSELNRPGTGAVKC